MEWIVVSVIVTIVGLFITVGKPIIKLNSNLVTLNVTIEHYRKELSEQKQALKDQKEHAHESHQQLWIHNNEQDEKIGNHETRLQILENERERNV